MVSQVIVDIRNQHVEDHAPIERFGIRFRMRPVARKSVDEFRVAPARSPSTDPVINIADRSESVCGRSDRTDVTEAPPCRRHSGADDEASRCRRVPPARRRAEGSSEFLVGVAPRAGVISAESVIR